jgi:hypothetical protein
MDSRGLLWVWIMGSQSVMGLDYGSNISDHGISMINPDLNAGKRIGFEIVT